MKASKEIKRPALTYYGGKWRLAEWIISYFPSHDHYVELCGGAASVLIQKPRSLLETYNDLDGNVVNFFQVLRENTDELIRLIKLTPWARKEFELSLEKTDDPIEAARRFFVCSRLSMSNSIKTTKGQFRSIVCVDKMPIPVLYNSELEKIASRFIDVQIEQMSYDYVLDKYDHEETLFYFDPPYVLGTRSSKNVYLQEFTNDDHIKAVYSLRKIKGCAVVSGYACPLYTELYEDYGWQRADKKTLDGRSIKRIESLWLSPKTIERLDKEKDLSDTMRFINEALD